MRDPLPIDALLPEITASLRQHPALVLVSPPGSGKTTRVPPALLDAGLAGHGRIVVLQPRRVAARLAARRISEERGGVVGREVGYSVRFERVVSEETRIEVVTEGLLTRRLQADPFLEGTSIVVLDEFHERSGHVDLALALVREAWEAGRDDLRVVVMSATMDPGPVAGFLRGAPVIRAEGRAHPVEIVYDPRPDERPAPQRCADGVRQALLAQQRGHVLAFLPGQGEIRRAAEILEDAARAGDRALANVDVLPLYGGLSAEAQDRALMPSRRRKVVLATNIAETSVTLDGVTAVVDTGLSRQPRFDVALGLDRLELGRISAASADQRAGRAGRTGPGLCRRLWTEAEQRALIPFDAPELARVDLAPVALAIRAWGGDPRALGWFERPPEGALQQAEALLRALGATEGAGLTRLGRALAALPLHPRLAAVVVAGAEEGCLEAAAAAAALASERDPWGPGLSEAGPPIDLGARVEALLTQERAPREVDRGAWRSAREATQQITATARSALGIRGPARRDLPEDEELVRVLLKGFPDRVGKRRAPSSDRVRLATGSGGVLDRRGDPGTELVLAVNLEAGGPRDRGEHRVRLACALEAGWLPRAAVTVERVLVFDPEREAVIGKRVTRYERLVLDERPDPDPPDPGATAALLVEAALARPERALTLDDSARRLQDRARFLRRVAPELALPDLDDLRSLLVQLCVGRRSLHELRALDVAEVLLGQLPWPARAALDRMAPETWPVPSGRSVRLEYPADGPPVLAARIQQLFGMRETPRLADGRVGVLVHLLAPNQRPMQVTQDLASFWANTYAEVRKDLRGRYPRHAWPEDPLTAIPEDRPQRRR